MQVHKLHDVQGGACAWHTCFLYMSSLGQRKSAELHLSLLLPQSDDWRRIAFRFAEDGSPVKHAPLSSLADTYGHCMGKLVAAMQNSNADIAEVAALQRALQQQQLRQEHQQQELEEQHQQQQHWGKQQQRGKEAGEEMVRSQEGSLQQWQLGEEELQLNTEGVADEGGHDNSTGAMQQNTEQQLQGEEQEEEEDGEDCWDALMKTLQSQQPLQKVQPGEQYPTRHAVVPPAAAAVQSSTAASAPRLTHTDEAAAVDDGPEPPVTAAAQAEAAVEQLEALSPPAYREAAIRGKHVPVVHVLAGDFTDIDLEPGSSLEPDPSVVELQSAASEHPGSIVKVKLGARAAAVCKDVDMAESPLLPAALLVSGEAAREAVPCNPPSITRRPSQAPYRISSITSSKPGMGGVKLHGSASRTTSKAGGYSSQLQSSSSSMGRQQTGLGGSVPWQNGLLAGQGGSKRGSSSAAIPMDLDTSPLKRARAVPGTGRPGQLGGLSHETVGVDSMFRNQDTAGTHLAGGGSMRGLKAGSRPLPVLATGKWGNAVTSAAAVAVGWQPRLELSMHQLQGSTPGAAIATSGSGHNPVVAPSGFFSGGMYSSAHVVQQGSGVSVSAPEGGRTSNAATGRHRPSRWDVPATSIQAGLIAGGGGEKQPLAQAISSVAAPGGAAKAAGVGTAAQSTAAPLGADSVSNEGNAAAGAAKSRRKRWDEGQGKIPS